MKGLSMITTVVGNAQVFLVVHDFETKRDYGIRIEISDPSLLINRTNVTLQGEIVMQERADLDFCKSGLKERLFDEC